MDNKLLLVKCITLLYRESQLPVKVENSADLVRTALETIKVSEIGIGIHTDRDTLISLKETAIEMCSSPQDHIYDLIDLLQRLKVNTGNDEKLYDALEQGMRDDLNESILKRTVTNIRKQILNHFKNQKIGEILNKASAEFKFNPDKIKNVDDFVRDMIAQLEPLAMSTAAKDPAVIDEVDIGDDKVMTEMFTKVSSVATSDRVYKTGWHGINRMLQGGFRPGEYWVLAGLQHKYKTGFSQSLFNQIAIYNKPLTQDPTKKPMMLLISFEDESVKRLQFMVQQLKYTETRAPVDIRDMSIEEMRGYIQTKLQVNGFHVRMLHVDPSMWGYRNLCHKVVELEAQGYNIEVLMVDYMFKMPTTGCVANGPIGSDFLDMMSRVRSFCIPRGILFLTPHQLSTECKILLRGNVTEDKLVKELVGKGYYEGSKRLDQVPDGILLIHLFNHNKESYLSIQRDRHRIPTICEEDDKYCLYKFPKGMPIPDDILGEDESLRKLSGFSSNASPDLFSLSI